MSYSMLPKEIWREISTCDSETYLVLVQCCTQFILPEKFIKNHFTRRTVNADGNIQYKLPNKWLHNTNCGPNGLVLPAIIWANGTQHWYKDGKQHRDDHGSGGLVLPASICVDGSQYWYKDGKLHHDDRGLDGLVLPAVISANGGRCWYKDGVRYDPLQ